MTVEVRILGSVEVTRDGARVDVRGDRQRTLLAMLALTPGQPRQLDRLVDAVWAESTLPADPRPAIHTCASRVRRVLGDHTIVSRGGAYVLEVPSQAIDAQRFDLLVDRAMQSTCTVVERIEVLGEALALWRGPALDGLAHFDWARADATRLDERRAHAEDLLAEALLESGRAVESIARLEAAAERQPLRERTHHLLMSALHAAGRQAEALRVFQGYRRRLATDLGLEPGEALVQLDRRIANGSAAAETGSPVVFPTARGYRLLERIGEGAFAEVYRGLQPAVGREVAIKVVREELANRPEFIRRFEAEAHLVARLEHPHIVPLYDYWREPYSAWLVMRLLRGGTLEDRIAHGRMALDDVIRMATQVGGALETAHRAGVVHRDVKPANVFLDDEGNSFLGDFGIAHTDADARIGALTADFASLDSASLGSPVYAAPEQLRRQPVGPPADIHGLAITVYEALVGHHPFHLAASEAEILRRHLVDPLPRVHEVRDDVPPAIDAVLARATAKRPEDRHATAGEFVLDLAAAAAGCPRVPTDDGPTVPVIAGNPYKGLLAFQEADAADYFGRDSVVDRLIERMNRHDAAGRFVVMVGPSGAGKSSALRAGLLPALRAGRIPGSDTWFVTTMMPGNDPFDELESALARVAGTSVGALAEVMRSGPRGIARAVRQVLPDEASELLLVLDQLEELFTLCADPAVRQQFAAGLVAAIGEPHARLRVVASLRADFYDRPLRIPELATAVEQGTVALTPLAAHELEDAITEPARRAGVTFEPGLVVRIVADVLDQPGALPLMQYALTELFDRRTATTMTTDAYHELGGLAGALGHRAEAIHDSLDHHARDIARRVFTRLVTPGDGTADTRRRVPRHELGTDPAIDHVIDAFGRARLLAFDHDPTTREPTVDVAHEALLREWSRLRGWLDDDRDGLRVHRHLTTAAAGWGRLRSRFRRALPRRPARRRDGVGGRSQRRPERDGVCIPRAVASCAPRSDDRRAPVTPSAPAPAGGHCVHRRGCDHRRRARHGRPASGGGSTSARLRRLRARLALSGPRRTSSATLPRPPLSTPPCSEMLRNRTCSMARPHAWLRSRRRWSTTTCHSPSSWPQRLMPEPTRPRRWVRCTTRCGGPMTCSASCLAIRTGAGCHLRSRRWTTARWRWRTRPTVSRCTTSTPCSGSARSRSTTRSRTSC